MKEAFPYFEKAEVAGFTLAELDAVADVFESSGWKAIQKYIGAIMDPVRPVVYANTRPEKQLELHKGLGAIYVAANLIEFVSSAKAQADRLMQQEESARVAAEHAKKDEV